MEAIIELNKKYGIGYQARLRMGLLDSTINDKPFSLYEVVNGLKVAIEEINKAQNTDYKLYEIMKITDEALRVNKSNDLASAKILKDIEAGTGELAIAVSQTDFHKQVIDGEEEFLMTARGVLLFSYFLWIDEKNEKAGNTIKKYCEHLAMKGYSAGKSQIWRELKQKNKDQAVEWLENTYDLYIDDDNLIIKWLQGR